MQKGLFRKNVRNVVQRILHELGDNRLCLFYGFGRPADRESSRGGSFRSSLHLDVCVGGLFDEGQVGVVLTNHCCKHRAWDGYLLRSEGKTVGEYTETTICRLILKMCTGNTKCTHQSLKFVLKTHKNICTQESAHLQLKFTI